MIRLLRADGMPWTFSTASTPIRTFLDKVSPSQPDAQSLLAIAPEVRERAAPRAIQLDAASPGECSAGLRVLAVSNRNVRWRAAAPPALSAPAPRSMSIASQAILTTLYSTPVAKIQGSTGAAQPWVVLRHGDREQL